MSEAEISAREKLKRIELKLPTPLSETQKKKSEGEAQDTEDSIFSTS